MPSAGAFVTYQHNNNDDDDNNNNKVNLYAARRRARYKLTLAPSAPKSKKSLGAAA